MATDGPARGSNKNQLASAQWQRMVQREVPTLESASRGAMAMDGCSARKQQSNGKHGIPPTKRKIAARQSSIAPANRNMAARQSEIAPA
jgi:hypothetical protein